MPDTPIGKLLSQWQNRAIEKQAREGLTLAVASKDLIRMQALAEIYGVPIEEIAASLISAAIDEAETRMPYIPGSRVIRVEEGDPVYEDVGLTPRYLEARRRLESAAPNNSR